MVEEMSEHMLWTSYHKAQSDIRSVVYKVVEKVMIDLLRKDATRNTIEAHIVKFLETKIVAEKFSKKLLTSSTVVVLILMFARHKIDTVIVTKGKESDLTTKQKPFFPSLEDISNVPEERVHATSCQTVICRSETTKNSKTRLITSS